MTNHYFIFIGTVFVIALTPGPNMIYLLSRSLCQGRAAGVFSWLGTVLGLVTHMICAAVGLTALFLAVPIAYDLMKFAGALYLLWMAWKAIRPGSRSPFEAQELSEVVSTRRLFAMGYLTSVLNPKIAIFYLSILPQFITPEAGSVFAQSLILGFSQIVVGATVNLLVVFSAAGLARWFAKNRFWLAVQRYVMGFVLGVLAIKLLTQQRSAA